MSGPAWDTDGDIPATVKLARVIVNVAMTVLRTKPQSVRRDQDILRFLTTLAARLDTIVEDK